MNTTVSKSFVSDPRGYEGGLALLKVNIQAVCIHVYIYIWNSNWGPTLGSDPESLDQIFLEPPKKYQICSLPEMQPTTIKHCFAEQLSAGFLVLLAGCCRDSMLASKRIHGYINLLVCKSMSHSAYQDTHILCICTYAYVYMYIYMYTYVYMFTCCLLMFCLPGSFQEGFYMASRVSGPGGSGHGYLSAAERLG